MQQGRHQAFGHHVADHLIAESTAHPLHVPFHSLPERGVLVFRLIHDRKDRRCGIDCSVKGIFGRDGEFLFGGERGEGQEASAVRLFGSTPYARLSSTAGAFGMESAGGLCARAKYPEQSEAKRDDLNSLLSTQDSIHSTAFSKRNTL